jgi:solute carrier family 45 protein 1/2/4
MVIPQFLITGVSAIIFAIFDPIQTHGAVRSSGPATENGTMAIHIASTAAGAARAIATREDALDYDSDGKSNSVVYIFRCVTVVSVIGSRGCLHVAVSYRLGGVASLIAFVLAWRLAREMRRQ